MNESAKSGRAYHSPLREAQTAQTRERIFLAAMDYLETHDIESMSLRQIAQLAGVSPPTVYAHFPTMDDLVTAFFHWVKARVALDQPLPPLDALASVPGERFPLYERHARLLFNLMHKPSWDRARIADRGQRHGVWLDNLHAELPDLSDAQLRLGARAILAFWTPTVWRWLKETCGFTPEESERVASWAISALTEALRRDPSGLDSPAKNPAADNPLAEQMPPETLTSKEKSKL
ncbi:MAG: TetR/AcrR family transcriptional regulator [Methylovirgula sp.]